MQGNSDQQAYSSLHRELPLLSYRVRGIAKRLQSCHDEVLRALLMVEFRQAMHRALDLLSQIIEIDENCG